MGKPIPPWKYYTVYGVLVFGLPIYHGLPLTSAQGGYWGFLAVIFILAAYVIFLSPHIGPSKWWAKRRENRELKKRAALEERDRVAKETLVKAVGPERAAEIERLIIEAVEAAVQRADR